MATDPGPTRGSSDDDAAHPTPTETPDAHGADAPDGASARDADAHADAHADAADRTDAADSANPANAAAPDPQEAAAPDEVIREPEDVEPDTTDGETGEARRVDEEGRTEPLADQEDRPNPKAALVYNPIKVDGDALREQVASMAADAGWAEPLFYETTVDDLGDDVTRQALEEGVDVVLVAGGDGTVRAVSEAMTGSDVPLAIVPSGTGNLLARNLRLPLDDAESVIAAAFDGDVHAIDVGIATLARPDGESEKRVFVVMGGMGLDAAMIANTSGDLKKKVGWVAYVDGAARSLVKAKPFPVVYQVPGHRVHRANVQSVVFANCGSLPAGLELIPEASVTDGALDIAIFQPKNPFGWLLVWRRVAWDNSFLRRFRAGRKILALSTRDNAVRFTRGVGIDLASQGAQPVQLDGDEFGEATHVTVRVGAGSLKVAVPRGHETSGL